MIYFKQDIPYLFASRKVAIDRVWVEMEDFVVVVKEREY